MSSGSRSPSRSLAAAARRSVGPALLLSAVGCGGANPSLGLEANLRVAGAQFVSGALTLDEGAAGPAVHTIDSANNRLYPGVQNKTISGTVDQHGAAVVMGLAEDVGHWIVPVSGEDQMSPPDLTFSARGSFSPTLSPGPHDLIFRAVGLDGAVGPSKIETLTLVPTPVDGSLVISLEWDGPADLDLHVVAPATGGPGNVEVWSKKRNSLAARSVADGPYTSAEIAAAGTLDFDSNSGCVFDGRDNENVSWTQQPPSGHYLARVDASSLCGAAAARWWLTVSYQGAVQARAFGQLGDVATWNSHAAGAGLTVWENDIL